MITYFFYDNTTGTVDVTKIIEKIVNKGRFLVYSQIFLLVHVFVGWTIWQLEITGIYLLLCFDFKRFMLKSPVFWNSFYDITEMFYKINILSFPSKRFSLLLLTISINVLNSLVVYLWVLFKSFLTMHGRESLT